MIDVADVSIAYGATAALTQVFARIMPGRIAGFVGRNGAGKTTLVEAIAGLRTVSAGRIRVCDMDPARDRAGVTRCLAIQPQSAQFSPALSVRETLALFAALHSRPRPIGDVVTALDLSPFLDTRVKLLSGGTERRLLLAIALLADAEILVLDEPSAGLDPTSRQEMWTVIQAEKAAGRSVLLTTHDMSEAEWCDDIFVMSRGRITATGSPAHLIATWGSDAMVSFRTPTSVEPAVFFAWDAPVTSAEATDLRDGGQIWQVRTADPDALLARLAFESGVRARGIRVRESTMNDVFTRLTGPDISVDDGAFSSQDHSAG